MSLTTIRDIDYEVMLHLDINSLINFVQLNQYSQKLSNNEFWRNKFYNDHLPLLKEHKTFANWVTEYKNTYRAKWMSEKMIHFIKLYNIKILILKFNIKEEVISHLPTLLRNKINKQTDDEYYTQYLVIFFSKRDILLKYMIDDETYDDNQVYVVMQIDWQALQQLFFNLFYHFKNLDILDESDTSFINLQNLETAMITYQTNTDYIKELQKYYDYWKENQVTY